MSYNIRGAEDIRSSLFFRKLFSERYLLERYINLFTKTLYISTFGDNQWTGGVCLLANLPLHVLIGPDPPNSDLASPQLVTKSLCIAAFGEIIAAFGDSQ